MARLFRLAVRANQTHNTDRIGIGLVEVAVNRNGWMFREQETSDHGIDAHIEPYINEVASGRLVALQIKSGNSYFRETTEDGYVFRGDIEHLDYWINHSLPVLLLLVDTDKSEIYWEQVTESTASSTGKGWKLEVPKANCLESRHFKQLEKIATNLRHFPQSLIDQMIREEIELLRKKRFFAEYDHENAAAELGNALLTGYLGGGSDEARAVGLAWSARVLARSDQSKRAVEFLERVARSWQNGRSRDRPSIP